MFLENTLNFNKQSGWIEVVCGSMFSGKTEELIRRIRRAEFANLSVIIFKPRVDVRDEKNKVVGVDEAQFFDNEIVKVCNELANRGVRVIVAGLDMDYKGVPFSSMANLMATAEYVTKVHAICPKTGGLAQYSYRKAKSKKRILLGKKSEYMPLSRTAYVKKIKKNK